MKMSPEALKLKALLLWEGMNPNERTGVRFGLFPAEPMTKAEQEGYAMKDLSVTLMKIADGRF